MSYIARCIHKLYKATWQVTKPVTLGARIILVKANKVLLVKHTYHDQWYLPGGGVKKGETYEAAIKRELKEELAADINNLQLFGIYNNFYEGKNDSIVIFLCDDFKMKGINSNEIDSYDFFDIDDLPDKVSPGTRKRIDEYKTGNTAVFGHW